jgi:hypothetical protein
MEHMSPASNDHTEILSVKIACSSAHQMILPVGGTTGGLSFVALKSLPTMNRVVSRLTQKGNIFHEVGRTLVLPTPHVLFGKPLVT